ncbi:Metapyrocatechase 2 [Colletotrichum fructicola]|nr:Metapyrocatechase 2 [Colletotrichum fructicola]
MSGIIASGSTEATSASVRKINLVRISHIYYTYKDLQRSKAFFEDFGFVEAQRSNGRVYYRGYGAEPFIACVSVGSEDGFGGAAFAVESEDDLIYASETLPSATKPYDLIDAPGGGSCVSFRSSVDGFSFHLVFGQKMLSTNASFPELDFNFPTKKHRNAGTFQRFEKGPAPVHKLGHFGVCVTDFQKTYDFFTSRFNFIPSDLVHDHTGRNVTAFLRLDRGEKLVDHHSFFFFEGPRFHVHHSSYETHDSDMQFLGHDWLRHRGYENCWGVGRHILGSQIFDYWSVLMELKRKCYRNLLMLFPARYDPSKFIFEHYVDGDQMNSSHPTSVSEASPNGLHIWGPDLPPNFLV